MARNPGDESQRLNVNLRQSVGYARNLSFAFADMSGKLGASVNAASQLAENIASVSKNAKIAASATGIGALVALIGTAVSFTIGWNQKTKEVASEIRGIGRDIAAFNAQATGNQRLVAETEIRNRMQEELEAAKKLEGRLRKFPELYEAIRAKAAAASAASAAERNRAFADMQFDTRTEMGLIFGRMQSPEEGRRREVEARRLRDLAEVNRNSRGFLDESVASLRQDIEDRYTAEVREIEHDIVTPLGNQLGRSFASSIADGIRIGIQEGSLAEGFKALLGGILFGLGDLMQEIGTQSLLAAKLFQGVIEALRSFAPAGAIGPALALIAGGAALKGIGAAMGGSGTSRTSPAGGFSSGFTSVVDRGLINPINPLQTAMAGLPRLGGNTFVIIGEDDPRAQRMIVRMVDKGRGRSVD